MIDITQYHIAIIGLGYVGLPLALAFGKVTTTVGYDIDGDRISALQRGEDVTLEATSTQLAEATKLSYSGKEADIAAANIYIITVPTPIDHSKTPDLTPVKSASQLVGRYLQQGDIVIYESTVYPGATEEVCVPLLEHYSGMTFNQDFFCGYSPERINPGDKERTLTTIVKVTSGSTPPTAIVVDELYQAIITAGTHKASSIKVAEAAKVIENTQRDINIALMNELSLIFHRVGIDTQEVLAAAGTKWNFLPFHPGLVGGHCIGVDPYYLVHKAESVGYHPELIASARRINDDMGHFVVSEVVKLMAQKQIHIVGSKILILGLTFKENCPDLRNTRVVDMVRALTSYHADVTVYDPWVDSTQAKEEYDIDVMTELSGLSVGGYDAAVIAVAHDNFKTLGHSGITALMKPNHMLYDIKHLFTAKDVDGRL